MHPAELKQAPETDERKVVLPQVRPTEVDQKAQTLAVAAAEPPPPKPRPAPEVRVPVAYPRAPMMAPPQVESRLVEREVPVVVEKPVVETVETVVPPDPVPVMVKTIHEQTVI